MFHTWKCNFNDRFIIYWDQSNYHEKTKDQQKENKNDEKENINQNRGQNDIDKFEVTYKDLMKLFVSDTDKLACMIHRCEKCFRQEYNAFVNALQMYLEKIFKQNDLAMEARYIILNGKVQIIFHLIIQRQ